MARSYSRDLRERVIGAVLDGMSARGAAARYGIGVATAVRWLRRFRDTGEIEARKRGQPGGSKLDPHEAFILALIEDQKDISLAEIALLLDAEHGVSTCPATIWYFLDRRGFSFKKNRSRGRARTA